MRIRKLIGNNADYCKWLLKNIQKDNSLKEWDSYAGPCVLLWSWKSRKVNMIRFNVAKYTFLLCERKKTTSQQLSDEHITHFCVLETCLLAEIQRERNSLCTLKLYK